MFRTLTRLSLLVSAVMAMAIAAVASPVTYKVICLDSTGAPVQGITTMSVSVVPTTGATGFTIASGSVTVGTTQNPTAAGAIVVSGSTTVKILDAGHGGVYLFEYDPAVSGEAEIFITPTKSGVSFAGDGTVEAFAAVDSSTVATIATNQSTNTTTLGTIGTGVTTLQTRIPGTVQPQTSDAYARLGAPAGASVSADIAALPAGVWGYSTGRTLTSQADTPGTTTLLSRIPTFPSNFAALAITSGGGVNLNLAQTLDLTQIGAVDTVGAALNGAHTAITKAVLTGTPGSAGSTLKLYAGDGVTILKTYDMSTASSKL